MGTGIPRAGQRTTSTGVADDDGDGVSETDGDCDRVRGCVCEREAERVRECVREALRDRERDAPTESDAGTVLERLADGEAEAELLDESLLEGD